MYSKNVDHPALKLFSELLVPSPSGREEKVASIIIQKLGKLNYKHELESAGNIVVRLEGRRTLAPLTCYAAHMDEIGIVVTGIAEDGSLRVTRSGGLRPWKIGERPISLLGDHEMITGMLSMGSTHTAVADKAIGWDDVWVMTGLSPAQLREYGVRPGTAGVPIRDGRGPHLFGDPSDPLVAGWTFDDRMGVVALLRLLEALSQRGLKPLNPTIVAFTVHEEVGGQGAKILAHRERPEIFVAVDGCPIPPEATLALDGRPGIWSKDRLAHYDQRLLSDLSQAAETAGTELQPTAYKSAASDASLVYYAGAAPRIACVGHVRENSHGYEVSRLSVFDHLLDTLIQFVTNSEIG